jgi:hypothetical protein
MTAKYVAFDIETAKDVPGTDFNWRPHRPLGITCIASMSSSCNEPRVWYGQGKMGAPLSQMSRCDVSEFVDYLDSLTKDSFTPLTWNGLSFDFDIIAEESNLWDQCKQLALLHVDMMFHIVCEKGFPVGLANAASGMGIQGKLRGVDGRDAPTLWLQGQHDTVIKYVSQDVRATLQLGIECETRRVFRWTTTRGGIGEMPLSQGWLPVKDAMRLPKPDTSWMSNPIQRESYAAWLNW